MSYGPLQTAGTIAPQYPLTAYKSAGALARLPIEHNPALLQNIKYPSKLFFLIPSLILQKRIPCFVQILTPARVRALRNTILFFVPMPGNVLT